MPRLLSNPVLLQLARCSGYSKLPTVIDTKGTYKHLVWDLYPGLVPISGCWIPLYTYTGFQREGWGERRQKADGSSPSTLVMEQTVPGFLSAMLSSVWSPTATETNIPREHMWLAPGWSLDLRVLWPWWASEMSKWVTGYRSVLQNFLQVKEYITRC